MLTNKWMHYTVGMAIVAMSIFVTATAEAQPRLGGGPGLSGGPRGGGSGEFFKGASGSGPLGGNFSPGAGSFPRHETIGGAKWQANRGQLQANRQSFTQQLQSRQQAGNAASQASRQNTVKDLQTRQQVGDAANREDWQSHANQSREDRQGYRTDAREDWQGYGEPRGGYYYGGYYGGYPVYSTGGVVAGMAIGTTMTAAAFNAQKASCRTVIVNGLSYYQCGSTWYQQSSQGGNVTYVVVNPPK